MSCNIPEIKFAMQVYSRCDNLTQKKLTCTSQQWKRVAELHTYKECIRERFAILTEPLLGYKSVHHFQQSLSKQDVLVELANLKVSLYAKTCGFFCSVLAFLPIELETPFSSYLRTASYSKISKGMMESLQKIYSHPKDQLQILFDLTDTYLSVGSYDEAMLFLDIAQKQGFIHQLLDKLLNQYTLTGKGAKASFVLKAIEGQSKYVSIHDQYAPIFKDLDEKFDKFNKKLSENQLTYIVYEELKRQAEEMLSGYRNNALNTLLRHLKDQEIKVYEWIDEVERLLGIVEEDDDLPFDDDEDFYCLIGSEEETEIPVVEESEEESSFPIEKLSVGQLMNLSPEEWNKRKGSHVNARLTEFISCFSVEHSLPREQLLGSEKKTVNIGDSIAVIGDLHGDGLRLDLTLKALKQQGFLDPSYKCMPGKHIVFLGDFMDRGAHNLKVLELVAGLKLENRDQVFLVKGNHEDISQNTMVDYTPRRVDAKYRNYMASHTNNIILQDFYNTLPDAVYLGQRDPETLSYEYAQYCHGLFYMYHDPNLILSVSETHYRMFSGLSNFSSRVVNIAKLDFFDQNANKSELKKIAALTKLEKFATKVKISVDNICWFDLGEELARCRSDRPKITPEYAKAYLRLHSTQDIKIKEIFRGHQLGDYWRLGVGNKPFITTIDPSQNQETQTFLIMTVAPKLKDYKRTVVTIPLDEDHPKALNEIKLTLS